MVARLQNVDILSFKPMTIYFDQNDFVKICKFIIFGKIFAIKKLKLKKKVITLNDNTIVLYL